ncbi:MAG: SDR family NAD(P)-dependent oxidoreductase [Acidimicrobiales bacterium]
MRILITGAARAIGAATATVLSQAGHEVIATARDVALLEPLDVSLRLALDVTDDYSIAEALARAGELDAVVNNAAAQGRGPLEDFPIDRLRLVFETNAIGPIRLLQHVLPTWRERGSGVIVNISSVQGRVSTPLEGAYAGSKYALEAMSETLHYELRHFGIRTVIIEPGYVAPGMKPAPMDERNPAYAQLWHEWDGTDSKLTGAEGRPGPEIVAYAVQRALEDESTPLRVPVGADAELILATRSQMDDAQFEALMRQTLNLRW